MTSPVSACGLLATKTRNRRGCLTLFTGRFGSGKSEIAINYALLLARMAAATLPRVVLIDLDVVTPYFRTRESAAWMLEHGVQVIAPSAIGRYLDTPAITPQIMGAIEQTDQHTVLDVGGDPQGARVLGMFSAAIGARGYRMAFVVNPYRPFTNTLEGLRQSVAEIESSSRLRVASLISNPNLLHETSAERIVEGHAQIEAFAAELGLPVDFVCLERRWLAEFGANHFAQPVLALDRFFAHPWEGAIGRQG